MATYKVLQDIEAEDKFIGPLTLKQFIYASITVLSAYISFLGLSRGTWIFTAILSPIMIFGGFLAWPWSKDQPTEVWLLAKVRFALKPRRRIWDQSGINDLVSITVPKHIERQLTDGLSQTEVKSRLQALANTIDSRGWAVKNVNINMFSQPSYVAAGDSTERLIDPAALPQNVPTNDITAKDDILDEQNSPTAQHFTDMINASSLSHRQEAVAGMYKQVNADTASNSKPNDYWFMNQPPSQQTTAGTFNKAPVVSPGATGSTTNSSSPTAEEKALLSKLHQEQSQPDPISSHMHTVQPVSDTVAGHKTHSHYNAMSSQQNRGVKAQQSPSTVTPDPAILELANNDDLNVATIARQADKASKKPPQDEVVISLR